MLGIADSNGNSLKHADASGKPFAVAGESLQSQKFPERFWINPAGEFHPIGRNSEHAKWIQDYARMTEEQAVSRGWIHGYKLRDSVWLTTGKQFSRAQKQTIDEYFTADNSVERVMLCVPAKGRPSIFSGRFKPYLVKPTYQGESVDKLLKARDIILEMASVSGHEDFYSSTPLYHGTPLEEKGQAILRDGFLKPGNEGPTNPRRQYEPMGNRVYLTPDLRFAIIYCIGANMIGNTLNIHHASPRERDRSPYGYLFQVDPSGVQDVLPDEDAIGELAHDLLKYGPGKGIHDVTRRLPLEDQKRFHHWFVWNLGDAQKRKVINYEDFGHLTQVGKAVAKRLPPEYVHRLAKGGKSSVAVEGKLPIIHAWRFDKRKNVELKPDGSNFFELAEQIK